MRTAIELGEHPLGFRHIGGFTKDASFKSDQCIHPYNKVAGILGSKRTGFKPRIIQHRLARRKMGRRHLDDISRLDPKLVIMLCKQITASRRGGSEDKGRTL